MNNNNAERITILKQRADTLWEEIVELGRLYWNMYDELFDGNLFEYDILEDKLTKEELPF